MESRLTKSEQGNYPTIVAFSTSSRHDDALTLAIDVMVPTILIFAKIRVVPRPAFENNVAVTDRRLLSAGAS
ncbi:hypothetical protein [Natrialba sp. PRR66]|uniref:hypothetical protein n=1 Tax=Natrialba sp. PRR66 TaxID=3098146 RepID=UPI002B1E175D|nr:hypothetical protein [Natrialba sp. PRR66]